MGYASMLDRLPTPWPEFLRQVGSLVAWRGRTAYLVGGSVRDLLLGRPVLDVDVVVEADAPSLAEDLVLGLGCVVSERSQFGTVKLEWKERAVDLVTARSESYHHPGALPTVVPGTIAEDLARRDFTVNAMGLCLHPKRWGALTDPHGGQRDLDLRLIRVLHSKSFQDDGTRILRAVRYCARLGFALEDQTRQWLLRDRDKLSTIGGERLFHELELIMQEETPEVALALAEELGVLAAIYPGLRFTPGMAQWFEQARKEVTVGADLGVRPDVFLCLLAYPLGSQQLPELARRLKLSGRRSQALEETVALRQQLADVDLAGLTPSALYRALEHYCLSALQAAAIAAANPGQRERVWSYLKDQRLRRTSLNGSDLIALGVPEGPEVGRRLRQLLDARLDGVVQDRDGEVSLVRRWAAEDGGTVPKGSN